MGSDSFEIPWTRLAPSLLALLVACSGGAEPADGASAERQLQVADWCDARAVILAKCVRCHADPPKNAAPFSLATFAATQVPSPTSSDPDRTRADRMLHAVETNAMPYTGFVLEPPVQKLSCEERETLLDWLRNGAPAPAAGDEGCADVRPRLLECSNGGAGGNDG